MVFKSGGQTADWRRQRESLIGLVWLNAKVTEDRGQEVGRGICQEQRYNSLFHRNSHSQLSLHPLSPASQSAFPKPLFREFITSQLKPIRANYPGDSLSTLATPFLQSALPRVRTCYSNRYLIHALIMDLIFVSIVIYALNYPNRVPLAMLLAFQLMTECADDCDQASPLGD